MIKQIIKATLCIVVVLTYMLCALICSPYRMINEYKFKKLTPSLMSFFINIQNMILGLEVKFKNEHLIPKDANFLFISNHLSYLDIFAIGEKLNLSYITSQEMKERPGVGLLCQLGGCSFVERRREKRQNQDREKELQDIYENLKNNVNIALYPEATSTNGQEVISFKKPMFIPAYNLKKPILVSAINYKSVDKKVVSSSNRDLICWYGKMDLLPHLLEFFKLKKTQAEITFIELVDSNKFDTIEELIQYCRELVIKNYIPIK